jgi:hypothetical protein
MDVSLCLLAHNGHEEAERLIAGFRSMDHVDVEVVVGKQGCNPESAAWYDEHADVTVEVTDRELWDFGFGYARQTVTDAANRDWCISADLGEVWHLNRMYGSLDEAVLDANPSPVLRVLRGDPSTVRSVVNAQVHDSVLTDDNGRIFDRREMSWLGIIHEALFHVGTGEVWALHARRFPPVFYIEHGGKEEEPKDFVSRKEVLYDHLIYELVKNPQRRIGTHHYWWTHHWENCVKPHFKEVSFEEWQEMNG